MLWIQNSLRFCFREVSWKNLCNLGLITEKIDAKFVQFILFYQHNKSNDRVKTGCLENYDARSHDFANLVASQDHKN